MIGSGVTRGGDDGGSQVLVVSGLVGTSISFPSSSLRGIFFYDMWLVDPVVGNNERVSVFTWNFGIFFIHSAY